MINDIQNYMNRAAISDGNVRQLEKYNTESFKNHSNPSLFEEEMRNAVNSQITGKIPSSSVTLPNNIKAEIQADTYRKKLFDASVEFESIFVKMMLTEMKKSVDKSGLIHGGYAEDIFEDFLYDEYAKNISKNESLGMAEQIYSTLSKSLPKLDLKA